MPRTTPNYLLRFDDICPTMNWRVWGEIETELLRRKLTPILAVVPDNRDPGLQLDPPAANFWERVRAWQDRGWTIALHGYQHRYVSKNAGIVAVRKKSEFAGLPLSEQWEKLRRAAEILRRENVTSRVWIAPGNTFDTATVSLLPNLGIDIICDGYFRFPHRTTVPRGGTSIPTAILDGTRPRESSRNGTSGGPPARHDRVQLEEMIWIPQQLFHFRPAPAGVWTVCYHHNSWTEDRMRLFRWELDHYGADIASLGEILDRYPPVVRRASAWLCAHPRLSRFLIRSQLKLREWTCGGKRASREAGTGSASPVARPSPH